MNRTILQQAIDTISYYASVCGEDEQYTPAKQTIEALRTELAKPEPEPVIWQKRHPVEQNNIWHNTDKHDAIWWRYNSKGWEIRQLFTKEQL